MFPRVDPTFGRVAVQYSVIIIAETSHYGSIRWIRVIQMRTAASRCVAPELVGFFAQQFIKCFDEDEYSIIHQRSLGLFGGE